VGDNLWRKLRNEIIILVDSAELVSIKKDRMKANLLPLSGYFVGGNKINKINSVAFIPPSAAKLVPTFVGRGCCVVCATDPYGR
jgi:hypothetical protein